MFFEIYPGYKIKSLIKVVKPFVEASDNEKLHLLWKKVTSLLFEEMRKEFTKEMDRTKKLPDRELLDQWYSCYKMIKIDKFCLADVEWEVDLYAKLLLERGLERHMEKLAENAENPDRLLSASAEGEYVQLLQRMTDAELLEEYSFYREILDFCGFNRQVKEDRQKKKQVELEVEKRGIKEAKGEYSEQSYN